MLRKKVKSMIEIKDWTEANEILRQIAERESRIEAAFNLHNEDEAKRREILDVKTGGDKLVIQQLALGLKTFCKERRDDFGEKQSKELSNGTVSFRKSTPKTKLLTGFKWDQIVDLIKKSKYKKTHIRTIEEPDKEKFISEFNAEKISNEDLKSLGFKVTQSESFGYEAKVATDPSTGSGTGSATD